MLQPAAKDQVECAPLLSSPLTNLRCAIVPNKRSLTYHQKLQIRTYTVTNGSLVPDISTDPKSLPSHRLRLFSSQNYLVTMLARQVSRGGFRCGRSGLKARFCASKAQEGAKLDFAGIAFFSSICVAAGALGTWQVKRYSRALTDTPTTSVYKATSCFLGTSGK
jgi:hypothetical protein